MYFKTAIRRVVFVSLVCAMVATGTSVSAQLTDMAIASTADTSHFGPNTKSGWGILLGYANEVGRDSARLEIVLFSQQAPNLQESRLIGWIRNRQLRPAATRVCPVQIGQRQFELKIEPTGAAWLRATAGPAPEAGKIILPMVIMYKR